MRKKLTLLLCLLAAAAVLTGCALVQRDTSVTVLTVNGRNHSIAEFESAMNTRQDALLQAYMATSDSPVDRESEAFRAYARGQVRDALVEQDVVQDLTAEYDAALTDEEAAAYSAYSEAFVRAYEESLQVNGDMLVSLVNQGYMTSADANEWLNSYALEAAGEPPLSAREKLVKAIAAAEGVTVSEEELTADLNTHIEADKTTYAENASAWIAAKNDGATLYYTPAGVRAVHQILVQFSEEEQAQLKELNKQIDEVNKAIAGLTPAEGSVEAAPETTVEAAPVTTAEAAPVTTAEAAPETTAEAAPVTTAEAAGEKTLPELQSELADLTAKADALWADLKKKADSVAEKARTGEDWAALTAEYNADPGMAEGSATAETGYLVCEGYSQFRAPFVEGAMALAAPGDISDPIRDDDYSGFYIIRYTSDAEEGPVSLDAVRDTLHDHLYDEKAQALYEEKLAQRVSEAKVTFLENLLNN